MGVLSFIRGTVVRYDFADDTSRYVTKTIEDLSAGIDEGVFEPVRGSPTTRYRTTGGIQGVIVELRREGEVLRQLTNARGEFVFDGLAPDTWEVRIFSTTLPDATYALDNTRTIVLTSGSNANVRFDILPKKLEIEFIGGGEL